MRNNILKRNLSFEEFIALAKREPDTNPFRERHYYRLEMTDLGEGPHNYPNFHVGRTHVVDFPTFTSAVNHLKKHSATSTLYRSRVTQLPLDVDESGRGAQWLYDGKGNLLDFTIVHKEGSPEETHFFGRELGKLRFLPWDIAELLQEEEVRLVQVATLMRTPNECWNIYRNSKDGYSLDYRADSYGILIDDAGTLEFALATTLMKPRFHIPPDIYDTIDSRFDNMMMSAIRGENPTVRAYRCEDDQ